MITFNQAKRLKDLGFPQPEPKFGQFWYRISSNSLFVVLKKKEKDLYLISDEVCSYHFYQSEIVRDFIYAPTVEEVMNHIDGYKRISQFITGKWYLRWDDAHQKMHETKDYPNPFDALIEVWEKINTK